MCLIIDVNVAHKILLTDNDLDFQAVHQLLFNNKTTAKVVYSQQFVDECKNIAIRGILAQLDKAGRAKVIDANQINLEISHVLNSGFCQSNDLHIIALARVSGVRLLCSHDQKLHSDFTNKKLIDQPRGKVYQNAKHKNLLKQFCS